MHNEKKLLNKPLILISRTSIRMKNNFSVWISVEPVLWCITGNHLREKIYVPEINNYMFFI